jgi:hypothetical protein
MRTIAITVTHRNSDIASGIVRWLKDIPDTRIVAYAHDGIDMLEGVENRKIPDDTFVSESKVKNFVTKDVIKTCGNDFIHLIEDTVEIFSDPSFFISEIERLMERMKIGSWFNTVTDPMNYTFKIYNPRFSIRIDEEKLKNVYDKTLYFTSHANTSWMTWNPSVAKTEDLLFDDRFSIPMYFIVKFLADRRSRHVKGELSYMNLYPTIEEERDVFHLVTLENLIPEPSNKVGEAELKLFGELKVDVSPTLDINVVMEDIVSTLQKEIP